MRLVLIVIASLFLLKSCENHVSSPLDSAISKTQVVTNDKEKSESQNLSSNNSNKGFKHALRLEKPTESEFSIVMEIDLLRESWIVSPLEKDYPYGPMTIDFIENEHLKLIDTISETPASLPLSDSNWNRAYRVLSGKTTLIQKIKIMTTDDFVIQGNIFFVLEPICTPYQLDFEIKQERGKLSLEEITSKESKH